MARTVRIPITLSEPVPAGQTVTVQYATEDGSAAAPTDYTAASGTLSFAAGEQSKFLTFVVRDLSDQPEDETDFRVRFSNPTGPTNYTTSLIRSVVVITIPGTPKSEPSLPIDRFKWVWNHLFDPDNRYMNILQYSGAEKTIFAPFYLSGLDSMIIAEDRLPCNSVDHGLQFSSETSAFVMGVRLWRRVILNDNVDNSWDNLADVLTLTQYPYVSTPASSQNHNNGTVDYKSISYEGDSLTAYPLTPHATGAGSVGEQEFSPSVWALMPSTPYRVTDGSTLMDHGFYYYDVILNTNDPNLDKSFNDVRDLVSSAINNTVTTATRGRFESVYQTLVPHFEYQPSAGDYGYAQAQHYKLFQSTTAPAIQADTVADEKYRTVYRTNPYADLMTLHWEGLVTTIRRTYQLTVSYHSEYEGLEIFENLPLAMFEKYNKKIGTNQNWVSNGGGTSFMGLMGCSFEIQNYNRGDQGTIVVTEGNSDCHHAFQNLMASSLGSGVANTVGTYPRITPTVESYFTTALGRQLVLLRWLQSPEGPIAGGVTASYNGAYDIPTDGRQNAKFCDMYYTYSPGKNNPPSNNRADWQARGHLGTVDYYYSAARDNYGPQCREVECILDRLVMWFLNQTELSTTTDGFEVPTELSWVSQTPVTGQTATAPNSEGDYEYLPNTAVTEANVNTYLGNDQHAFWSQAAVPNVNLHCTVTKKGLDLGMASAMAYILIVYAKTKDILGSLDDVISPSSSKTPRDALDLATELLDRIWRSYRDDVGLAADEERPDYNKMFQPVFVNTLNGTLQAINIYRVPIANGKTFIDYRPFLKLDAKYPEVEDYAINGGPVPVFRYHRTWVQCMYGIANAAMHYHWYM